MDFRVVNRLLSRFSLAENENEQFYTAFDDFRHEHHFHGNSGFFILFLRLIILRNPFSTARITSFPVRAPCDNLPEPLSIFQAIAPDCITGMIRSFPFGWQPFRLLPYPGIFLSCRVIPPNWLLSYCLCYMCIIAYNGAALVICWRILIIMQVSSVFVNHCIKRNCLNWTVHDFIFYWFYCSCIVFWLLLLFQFLLTVFFVIFPLKFLVIAD